MYIFLFSLVKNISSASSLALKSEWWYYDLIISNIMTSDNWPLNSYQLMLVCILFERQCPAFFPFSFSCCIRSFKFMDKQKNIWLQYMYMYHLLLLSCIINLVAERRILNCLDYSRKTWIFFPHNVFNAIQQFLFASVMGVYDIERRFIKNFHLCNNSHNGQLINTSHGIHISWIWQHIDAHQNL